MNKTAKSKDIRELGSEELKAKEKALKKELFDLKFQRQMGRVEKPARFKQIRREIARILTVITERDKNGTKS